VIVSARQEITPKIGLLPFCAMEMAVSATSAIALPNPELWLVHDDVRAVSIENSRPRWRSG
jgi:hypothetical protein